MALVAAAMWAGLGAPAGTAAAGDLGPLRPEARQALAAITPDPPPAKLLNGQHYVVSDEHRPERFREVLEGRGGALVGVGTDQNYLFAGWARPELVWIVDFDQTVVDLHTAYRAFFEHAERPEAFLELWSAGGRERARAAVASVVSSEAERRRVDYAMRIGRHLVHGRLSNLRARFEADGVPTLLNDDGQYRYVRQLVRSGRFVAVRGDVTGPRTVREVGRTAQRLGIPVRVLYLSNVEQYVRYSPRFRDNVRALPVDGRSVVLRTYHRGPGEGYVYAVQRTDHFRRWLEQPRIRTLGDMLWRARRPGPAPLLWLSGPAPSR